MGKYIDPKKAGQYPQLRAVGETIEISHSILLVQAGGKRLFAVMHNLQYYIAVDVTELSEYASFYRASLRGHWVSMTVHAIPADEADVLIQAWD